MKETIQLIHPWKKAQTLPGFIPQFELWEILTALPAPSADSRTPSECHLLDKTFKYDNLSQFGVNPH
jgi:hypothetical protein